MPTTLQMTLTDECHSFASEQPTEKRDAPKRIPRSPNAFMLYRSDFLKSQAVPPEVEKRQQNLSRIAGRCWNMLSDNEKAIWFNKAAIIRAEHRAKYSCNETRRSHRDTNKLSAKVKRREGATKSVHPFGRSRRYRTRTPYCEGMFAALHDSKLSSPESQASPLSSTHTTESPLSTTALLSPIALPHLLSSFPSPAHFIMQESPSATSDNSEIRGGKFDSLLDPPGLETPLWGLSQIIPIDIGSLTTQNPTLQQYEDDLASCAPYSSQVPLTLPGSSIFSSASLPLADYFSLSNSLTVTDNLAPLNKSLVPLYPA